MSLFGKIFGKKQETSQPPSLKPPPASTPPSTVPKRLKVWDAYGRIMEIDREEWRTKILPGNFRKAWNNPDELANLIHASLNDQFIADCLEPAQQLNRIDPMPHRGATFLGIVLLQLNQFEEAEKVFTDSIRRHGEDSVVMTNLAKAYTGKGNASLAESTLWHALELDPNQDNGLVWYQAIHRDRGGNEAGEAAMRRVAAIPESWRAQLWLARASLNTRKPEAALDLYRESLSRVSKPIPTDLLMQISGDLGNAGYLPEILQLVEPNFDVTSHGIQVGNNLIKAHVDLGQLDAARRILDQLYAQKRPDWNENLGYWDKEIAKARIVVSDPQQTPIQIAMLTIDGPVWLNPSYPGAELFPAKTGERISVAFLGSTVEIITNSKRTQQQLTDPPGRMSRSLPLFLAEQVDFCSNARVQTLVPWILGESPGFVVGGFAWSDEDSANYARSGEIKNDYVVTTYLKANAEPWSVDLRLVRTIDAKCLGTLNVAFPMANPEQGVIALAARLLKLLREQAELDTLPTVPLYEIPLDQSFCHYLVRLEQLLGVRCAGMDGVQKSFMNGEREIVDGNLQLCVSHPQNICTRILLAQTLLNMKRIRPDILPEFKDKIALLQKEKPLADPAQSVVQRMMDEAFS